VVMLLGVFLRDSTGRGFDSHQDRKNRSSGEKNRTSGIDLGLCSLSPRVQIYFFFVISPRIARDIAFLRFIKGQGAKCKGVGSKPAGTEKIEIFGEKIELLESI